MGTGVPGSRQQVIVSLDEEFPALLQQAKSSDPEAMTRIYRDLSPLVLGYARSLGTLDPEDVASETFVSVVRGLTSFTGDEASFRSWVLTIAYRRATDALRRVGRRREDPLDLDDHGGRVFDLASGDDQAMARLQAQGALEAIDQLTDDQRAVLLLRVLADLPVREVAAIVGKPESAVKALQRRAVASVRRRMKDTTP
jgi:RNA polymerase sigma-70 factor (ECF subfamily)